MEYVFIGVVVGGVVCGLVWTSEWGKDKRAQLQRWWDL